MNTKFTKITQFSTVKIKITDTSPGKPDSESLGPSASKSVNILHEDASTAAGEVPTYSSQVRIVS